MIYILKIKGGFSFDYMIETTLLAFVLEGDSFR